jgi:U3 small nucleolar RNA-associated protein 20
MFSCHRLKYLSLVLHIQIQLLSFPQHVLTAHSGFLFITLGAQLVNDDSPECRKMVAHCLKAMLERLDRDARNQLFDIVTVWLKDGKVCKAFYFVE